MTNLSTTFAGLSLHNPVIAGSCGLTDSVKGLQLLEKNGAAAVVLKSLFEEEIVSEMKSAVGRMNADRELFPETTEYYDDLDENLKIGTDKYLQLVMDARKELTIPVIASVNCLTPGQWTYFPAELEKAGASALELNIFLLPTNLALTSEQQENMYFEIVDAVRKTIKIPLILKLPQYFSSLGNVIMRLSEKVDGMVLFNRYFNPDFDISTREISSGGVLSSPSDLFNSLRWIAIMSGRTKCPLAASSGVHDHEALIKQLLAGAKAVEAVSTIYRHGPEQIGRMLDGLETWMKENHFTSLNDFTGSMSQQTSQNPAAYERVQFMKYFRGYQY